MKVKVWIQDCDLPLLSFLKGSYCLNDIFHVLLLSPASTIITQTLSLYLPALFSDVCVQLLL